jgi:hypothetical protein
MRKARSLTRHCTLFPNDIIAFVRVVVSVMRILASLGTLEV